MALVTDPIHPEAPSPDFVAAVNDWTGGHGFDVVLDCVGGDTFRRSLDATAHYGSVVTLLEPGADVSWKEARTRNLRIGFELMLTPMLRRDERFHRLRREMRESPCASIPT